MTRRRSAPLFLVLAVLLVALVTTRLAQSGSTGTTEQRDAAARTPSERVPVAATTRNASRHWDRTRRGPPATDPPVVATDPVDPAEARLAARFVFASGRPAAGLAFEDVSAPGDVVLSDADGRVTGTTDAVRLAGHDAGARYALGPDPTTYVVPEPVTAEVRIVQSRTGARLHVPGTRLRWKTGRRAAWRTLEADADGRLRLPVTPGVRLWWDVVLPADPSRAFTEDGSGATMIARDARELRITVPVHPPVRVTLHLTEPSGDPVRSATLRWAGFEGGMRFERVALEPGDAPGTFVLDRLPTVAGARLEALVATDTGTFVELDQVPLDRGDREIRAVATPDGPRGVFGTASPGFDGFGPPPPAPDGGGLSVLVLRNDGRPAAHVRVTLSNGGEHRTDAAGRFETFAYTGRVTLRLHEPGLVPTTLATRFPDSGTREVVLAEDLGGTCTVVVVDPRGAPVPAARVSASDHAFLHHVQWDGDVQVASLLTDALGRLTLTGLPRSGTRLDVRAGGRTVLGETGAGGELRLVLPDAPD